MKKLIFLTVILLIGVPGCDDCKCPEASKYIDINGMNSLIVKKAPTTSGLGTAKAGDKVSWDEIDSFSVPLTTRLYGYHALPRSTVRHWGTAVYACDCDPPGYLGTQEKIKKITVKTAFDFDASYPAGRVIDEIVTVGSNPKNVPLIEYLSKGFIPYYQGSSFRLFLIKAPSAKGPFALDITLELDNGEVYTTRTPVIELI